MITKGGGRVLEINIADREILGRPRDRGRPWGLFVKPDGFQGWQGISATRREALARAVSHGEHDVPVYLGSRVVTIDGHLLAPTEDELGSLADKLTGLLGVGRTVVNVHQHGRKRWARGRVSLAVAEEIGKVRARLYQGSFQLQVTFADPRRYGETRELPSRGVPVPVANRGNFPAFPEVVVLDAPASYAITSPGGTFTVSGATAGGTHVVNLRNGRVTRNGVEMFDVGRGSLWAVPPGPAWEHVITAPGLVRITDTYV